MLKLKNLFTVYIFLDLKECIQVIFISISTKRRQKFFKFIMESNVANFSSSCGALKVGREKTEKSFGFLCSPINFIKKLMPKNMYHVTNICITLFKSVEIGSRARILFFPGSGNSFLENSG